MLCNAYYIQPTYPNEYVQEAYVRGWVTQTAIMMKDVQASYCFALGTGFIASGIPVYNQTYYEGKLLTHNENVLRIGKKLNYIDSTINENSLITKQEAERIISLLPNNQIIEEIKEEEKSPYLVTINNIDNIPLDDILFGLNQIPMEIINQFNEDGWQCTIDLNYLSELSKQYYGSVIGLTSFGKKTLYVTNSISLLHEFGHYVDGMLGFPLQVDILFEVQAENSPLWANAKKNRKEYFADCFSYWINYSNNEIRMNMFKELAPQTYEYMNSLFNRFS